MRCKLPFLLFSAEASPAENVNPEIDMDSELEDVSSLIQDPGSKLPTWFYPVLFGGLALLFWAFSKPISGFLVHLFFPRLRDDERPESLTLKQKLKKLITYLLVATFALIAVATLPSPEAKSTALVIFDKAIYTLYVAGLLYFIHQTLKAYFNYRSSETKNSKRYLNHHIATYLATLSNGVFWVIAIILILSIWISNLSTFIAGLGIGGLALALAAQDTIANFFGSLSLVIDHPFEIGDWIETKDFSGTVERIGLRSTKVRQIDDASIYVPNHVLAKDIIVNGTRRRTRRVTQTVSFKIDSDTTQLTEWAKLVSEQLDDWEGVVKGESLVYLETLSMHAYVFTIRFLTSADFTDMLLTKQRVVFKALEMAKDFGLEPAEPQLKIKERPSVESRSKE